jgi:hypothetical protein
LLLGPVLGRSFAGAGRTVSHVAGTLGQRFQAHRLRPALEEADAVLQVRHLPGRSLSLLSRPP